MGTAMNAYCNPAARHVKARHGHDGRICPMNILLVHQYALPPSSAGGTRHFALARRLVRMGHNVTVIASRYSYSGTQTVSDVDEETLDGVRFVWLDSGQRGRSIPERALNMVGFGRAVAARMRAMEAEGAGWDAIIASSPAPFAALAATIQARRRGIPLVLEIRDLWPLSARDLAGWSDWHPGWLILRQVEKYLYRSADHIVTLLPGSEGWITASGGDPARMTVIPNGVDLDLAPDVTPMPRGEQFTFIFAGAHGVANGLDTLVRAAKLVAERPGGMRIGLRLLGDGPKKAGLMQLARELEVTNVVFDDPVPKSQVQAELARADACILHLKRVPTFAHGVSPNKLFDYLLAARPTLFCVNSPNDPVTAAGAGLGVVPEDPEALADAMLNLAARPVEELEEMGRRGRAFVMAEHEWDGLAQRFAAVLEGAVAARKGDGA